MGMSMKFIVRIATSMMHTVMTVRTVRNLPIEQNQQSNTETVFEYCFNIEIIFENKQSTKIFGLQFFPIFLLTIGGRK